MSSNFMKVTQNLSFNEFSTHSSVLCINISLFFFFFALAAIAVVKCDHDDASCGEQMSRHLVFFVRLWVFSHAMS